MYEIIIASISTGKDAALDAAHSLKTDTDSKLYGMGVRDGNIHINAWQDVIVLIQTVVELRMYGGRKRAGDIYDIAKTT